MPLREHRAAQPFITSAPSPNPHPTLPLSSQLALRYELPDLYNDTRPPPELLAAFGSLWRSAPSAYIGAGSRTPLHFDLLENLLCVVLGRKVVQLWHPAYGEKLYPGGGGQDLFSQVDPLSFDAAEFPDFVDALPLAHTVELEAGDALYLPCAWWHLVSAPPGVRTVSLSYWAQQPHDKVFSATVTEDDYVERETST